MTPPYETPPRAGRYRAILADPPWRFLCWTPKGRGRSPDAWYDTMTIEEICKIPVADWAAEDCALFLWITDPQLPQGLRVMEAWGFRYTTVAFYWAKLRRAWKGPGIDPSADFHMGLGYWTRANPEICLLGVRGRPVRKARDVRKLVVSPVREHSRKPDEIRDQILRLVDGPALEMFARSSHPGWDAWGKEVGLLDEEHPVRRFPSTLRVST